LNFNIAKVMSIDQLETQITELDNLPEHREIVTFMRRSAPLNTSQRTALEDYRDLILEYPVGLRQHFEHPERPLTVEIGFGMGRSLVLMAKANPERNYVGIEVHVPGIAQCVYEAGMAGLKTYVYWMQMQFKCYVKCQTTALTVYNFTSQTHGKKASFQTPLCYS
jgi:tRNA (guanine-N7-)-methyltransferase